MPGTDNRFLTAEGQRVELAAPGYDLSYRWHSSVVVEPADPARGLPAGEEVDEFHVTTVGNFAAVIKHELGGRVSDRLSMRGGEFILADGAEQGVAVWQGPWHEIAIFLRDPVTPMSEALARFDGLTFADEEDGLRVATTSAGKRIRTIEVWKWVPGVGGVVVDSPAESVATVPTWQGARIRTGEVWRIESEGAEPGERPSLVLGTPTCAVTVEPDHTNPDPEAVLTFLTRIETIWWS